MTNRLSRFTLDEDTRRTGTDLGLLVLRVAVGTVFVTHGWGDATQPGGAGANVENYRGAGIPLPELSAWYGAYLQLIGGAVLILGGLTRLVGLGLVSVMAGALIWVHRGEPLVMGQDGSGSGFAFIMLAASLALVGTGAGRYSIDGALRR
ncbi:DoxX family protein [Jiangella aurantiaca]|uniref:DoxX family protein n=2 Tax=Jiangella aurantiaca TaxID=2530373 RepID=A0A4R5AHD4_9ACTN|nr:DoxX family protein [Jiangella aurantiaca]